MKRYREAMRGSRVPRIRESARRNAGRLVVVRAGGGRERGAWQQARAFSVEADGSARLLSLSHRREAELYFFNSRRVTFSEGRAAA